MEQCKVVEDLLPLYEEGLVQNETARWIEQHLANCESCASVTNIELPVTETIQPEIAAEKTIAKTKLKLTIYQLLFVVLSFIVAMNTAIFTNKGFHFILSYFVLGAIVYGFYKSWLLTIALSFIPIFVWTLYDVVLSYNSIAKWWQESLQYESPVGIILNLILGGVITAMFHTLFAVFGALFIALLKKAFHKEEAA